MHLYRKRKEPERTMNYATEPVLALVVIEWRDNPINECISQSHSCNYNRNQRKS